MVCAGKIRSLYCDTHINVIYAGPIVQDTLKCETAVMPSGAGEPSYGQEQVETYLTENEDLSDV